MSESSLAVLVESSDEGSSPIAPEFSPLNIQPLPVLQQEVVMILLLTVPALTVLVKTSLSVLAPVLRSKKA